MKIGLSAGVLRGESASDVQKFAAPQKSLILCVFQKTSLHLTIILFLINFDVFQDFRKNRDLFVPQPPSRETLQPEPAPRPQPWPRPLPWPRTVDFVELILQRPYYIFGIAGQHCQGATLQVFSDSDGGSGLR